MRNALAIVWTALIFGSALSLPLPAGASEEEAELCVRTKVWDGYAEGWAIRTMTSTSLADGTTKNYLVTLYAGNDYQFTACADGNSGNLDLLLYDRDGRVVARDETKGREPQFTYKPTTTATFYVVLYAQKSERPSEPTGVGLAVSYR